MTTTVYIVLTFHEGTSPPDFEPVAAYATRRDADHAAQAISADDSDLSAAWTAIPYLADPAPTGSPAPGGEGEQ